VTEAEEPRVRMRHVRAARLCARGARAFFARHGLDWNGFLSAGIPATVLECTGDPNALKAAAAARQEARRG